MIDLKINNTFIEKAALIVCFKIIEWVSINEIINKFFVSIRDYVELTVNLSKCLI